MTENLQAIEKLFDISALDPRAKAAIVGMFFARLPSSDIRYKSNCYKVIGEIAEKYGFKKALIKNDKDAFDAQFENGRQGWKDKPLLKRNKMLDEIYEKYKILSIAEHEQLVEKILEEIRNEDRKFFSIKTKDSKTVEAILAKNSNIEFDGLNILKDSLSIGQLVFIVFGGDKPAWKTGLVGMGTISKPPYDLGYEGKNYKIQVDIKLLLDNPIKREDLVPYKDTYDIIGIGPITKWEPNQAISQIAEKNAVALMRAMLELSPSIENDLKSIVDDSLMGRIKGATTKYMPVEVDFGEKLKSNEDTEVEPEQINHFSEIYMPNIDEMLDGISMDDRALYTMKNFINAGKHIIFNGPPGTGKTTLAERACEQAMKCNYVNGYIMTTAIADWSTFDTIGGYMPDKSGNLIFQEGVFLKSIRENKWLIIDEINRAEVDKAFGHFFTVLSGSEVELQYKVDTPSGERSIRIGHTSELASHYDVSAATYYIGQNWRILATMNTYDKNSLFMLSYAFMRRFSFIYISAPSDNDFNTLISERLMGRDDIAEILLSISRSSPKKLGAAIVIDLIKYLESSEYNNLIDGICSLIIPQYEGISIQQIKQLYKDFGSLFEPIDKDIFRTYLCEFFDVRESELLKVKFFETTGDLGEEELDNDE